MYLSIKMLLNLLQTFDENKMFSSNTVNFFFALTFETSLGMILGLRPTGPSRRVDHSANKRRKNALTHAEKSQLGMKFRNALNGSSRTTKCQPV